MVSELFQKVQDRYIQQRELGWRGKGHRQHPSTAASHFLQSLTELTSRLERYQNTKHAVAANFNAAFDLLYHIFFRCKTTFIHCVKPNYIKVTSDTGLTILSLVFSHHQCLTAPVSHIPPTASWNLWCWLCVGTVKACRDSGHCPHQEGRFPCSNAVLLLHGEVQ